MVLKVDMSQVDGLLGDARFQAYGCLDATGTREIYDKLIEMASPKHKAIYRWTIAQLGPAITMGRRGILVNQEARTKSVNELTTKMRELVKAIQVSEMVVEVWKGTTLNTGKCSKATRKDGRHKWPKDEPDETRKCVDCGASRTIGAPINPLSDDQLAHLLYDLLLVPPPGGRSGPRSVDKDALASIHRIGRTFQETKSGLVQKRRDDRLPELIDMVREARDCQKQIGFLMAPLCKRGRYHSNFRPHGTWTGRWSSKQDAFDLGGNAQNIAKRHRYMFEADAGMEMFYTDLKTAESLIVAHLAGEEDYIEAHKGDVHTYVCRLVWHDLPWTGDLKKDKELAKTMRPEWDDVDGHDYRFQAKRLQHGSNYGLTPAGMARLAHIPMAVAHKAQYQYFKAFPRIREWQKVIFQRTGESLPIETPFGREVILMGRPWDEHTFKQGLALGPQSLVGDILDTALWNLWAKHDPDLVELLAQVHDAILGQYLLKNRAKALAAIRIEMAVPLMIEDIYGKSRQCIIGSEIETGPTWGDMEEIEL